MYSIISTRYTDETLNEKYEFMSSHNIDGCLYGAPQPPSPKILLDSLMFVIEMNNSKNKIEGIGLIRNKPITDKYYKIYRDANFNRYIYRSQYYMERETLERYNSLMVKIFDHILFKEKTHLKRGCGFTTVPEKLLQHKMCNGLDLKKELQNIFLEHFSKVIT